MKRTKQKMGTEQRERKRYAPRNYKNGPGIVVIGLAGMAPIMTPNMCTYCRDDVGRTLDSRCRHTSILAVLVSCEIFWQHIQRQ
jgi:hypothetical protein